MAHILTSFADNVHVKIKKTNMKKNSSSNVQVQVLGSWVADHPTCISIMGLD